MSKDVVESLSYQLYDLEYITGSSTLRVYIMNPETKTADLDDCVKITRAMNPFFEEEAESEHQWIPNDIVLEVSSPGIDRSLKTMEHFEWAIGETIYCKITGKLDEALVEEAPKSIKKANTFKGLLKEVSKENIVLEVDGFVFPLSYEQIKKANIEPEI